jgi:hypothetical protein
VADEECGSEQRGVRTGINIKINSPTGFDHIHQYNEQRYREGPDDLVRSISQKRSVPCFDNVQSLLLASPTASHIYG